MYFINCVVQTVLTLSATNLVGLIKTCCRFTSDSNRGGETWKFSSPPVSTTCYCKILLCTWRILFIICISLTEWFMAFPGIHFIVPGLENKLVHFSEARKKLNRKNHVRLNFSLNYPSWLVTKNVKFHPWIVWCNTKCFTFVRNAAFRNVANLQPKCLY